MKYTHDDVTKWKHFPRYWSFVREIHCSLVYYPHKKQWRRALMFSLICVWTNELGNNRFKTPSHALWHHCPNYRHGTSLPTNGIAVFKCKKVFSQWRHSFQRKLCPHWLKGTHHPVPPSTSCVMSYCYFQSHDIYIWYCSIHLEMWLTQSKCRGDDLVTSIFFSEM